MVVAEEAAEQVVLLVVAVEVAAKAAVEGPGAAAEAAVEVGLEVVGVPALLVVNQEGAVADANFWLLLNCVCTSNYSPGNLRKKSSVIMQGLCNLAYVRCSWTCMLNDSPC